jgi:hypothetical protein
MLEISATPLTMLKQTCPKQQDDYRSVTLDRWQTRCIDFAN